MIYLNNTTETQTIFIPRMEVSSIVPMSAGSGWRNMYTKAEVNAMFAEMQKKVDARLDEIKADESKI